MDWAGCRNHQWCYRWTHASWESMQTNYLFLHLYLFSSSLTFFYIIILFLHLYLISSSLSFVFFFICNWQYTCYWDIFILQITPIDGRNGKISKQYHQSNVFWYACIHNFIFLFHFSFSFSLFSFSFSLFYFPFSLFHFSFPLFQFLFLFIFYSLLSSFDTVLLLSSIFDNFNRFNCLSLFVMENDFSVLDIISTESTYHENVYEVKGKRNGLSEFYQICSTSWYKGEGNSHIKTEKWQYDESDYSWELSIRNWVFKDKGRNGIGNRNGKKQWRFKW